MKDDRALLEHIRDAIVQIKEYTKEGKNQFFQDKKTQDAVIRQLEIIGEAAKSLSDASKKKEPGIPWKQISGMRDKMIHEYFGVDLTLVWDVVEKNLSSLALAINKFLK